MFTKLIKENNSVLLKTVTWKESARTRQLKI